MLGIGAGLGGRSVGTSKFDDESETIEVDDASTHLPNQSSLGVVPRQEYRPPQKKPASSDRPSPSSRGSGSEDGVGDTSLTGTVLLKGLHLSAAEGDTEEGLSFAWTWTVTLSGIGEEVSRDGCCCNAGEMDTSELIAGERSERSANLERGDMEGTAKAFEAIDDVGREGGGGMRCCSSTTTISRKSHSEIRKEKKIYPGLKSSPNESQVTPSQDAPPTPAQLLDRPPPLPSSPQSHDASTAFASWAASCPRPALAVSHLCRSLIL